MMRLTWLLSLLVVSSVWADATLDPATYRSPSGVYELFVDPTHPNGAGPGRYEFSKDGDEVWSGERPFTLWDAIVTDDGRVAGYAYDEGRDGRSRSSTLLVMILGADGEILLEEVHARTHSGVMSNPPSPFVPIVTDLIAAPDVDRVIVEVSRTFAQEQVVWWTYDLHAAAPVRAFHPDQPSSGEQSYHRAAETRHIPGTPLILIHWIVADFESGRRGALFSVVTTEGRELWRFEIPAEYDDAREWTTWRDLDGLQQTFVERCGFSIRSVALGERVAFEVNEDVDDDAGWSVHEVARHPDSPGVDAAFPPAVGALPEISLDARGVIRLTANATQPSISNVNDFAIDERGQIGFIRRRDNGATLHLVVVAGDQVVREVAVPPTDSGYIPRLAALGGGRWLLVRRHSSADGHPMDAASQAWIVDEAAATLAPIEGFDAPAPDELARLGEGGFCLGATMEDAVVAFDTDGERRWSIEVGGGMLAGIASRPGGGIAVLRTIADAIDLYDADGALEGTYSVSAIIGGAPNNVVGLEPDVEGGFILYDFRGAPPIHRIRADGTRWASFEPRFADGRTVRLTRGVVCGPGGALWTSDGDALLRLDDDGVVTQVLGRAPDDADLDRVDSIQVDFDGRIYALCRDVVHVFDESGAPLRTLRSDPTDFPGNVTVGPLSVSGTGAVYVARKDYLASNPLVFLMFTPDGERAGFVESVGDRTETWHFQPTAPGTRWVVDLDSIALVDVHGTTRRSITRRADRGWLDWITSSAVGPDGSLAVISGRTDLFFPGPPMFVTVYEASGEPRWTRRLEWDCSSWHAAHTGAFVAVTTQGDELLLLDAKTGDASHALAPIDDDSSWRQIFATRGGELWITNSRSDELHRFALPESPDR